MTIVVTTPTGHVGSRVVRLLLQAGVRPRLLARDPARLDAAVRERADVRRGDLTDPEFVRASLTGTRTLFWVDPTPHTDADPIGTSLRTALPVADAARAGEVARIVLLSSGGAEKRHGAGHIDGLGAIEELFDATGADVTHLRCGYFFTNLLQDLDALAAGELTTSADPDHAMPWVDPRDIGEVAAARLLSDGWQGRVVQAVHGPADLTFAEVADTLTDVLGHPVRLRVIGDDDVRKALTAAGLPHAAVEGIVGMTAGLRDFVFEQPRDMTTTTPTTLAAWAHTDLRAALAARA